MRRIKRPIFLIFGGTSLALGVLGMLLPVLPTTPFLILSAYFFSRGSERAHSWMLSRPYFGKIIKDWEDYGVIRKKAKIQAVLAILLFFSYSIIFLQLGSILKISLGLIGPAIIYFIISRPSKITTA
jgi:uncharacterized protein